MSNTYIDGGGVFDDVELPKGSRIRFNVPGAREAITVFVDEDRLRAVGQYQRLEVLRATVNVVEIRPIPL